MKPKKISIPHRFIRWLHHQWVLGNDIHLPVILAILGLNAVLFFVVPMFDIPPGLFWYMSAVLVVFDVLLLNCLRSMWITDDDLSAEE